MDSIHIWKLHICSKKSKVSPVFPGSCIPNTASAAVEFLAVPFSTHITITSGIKLVMVGNEDLLCFNSYHLPEHA